MFLKQILKDMAALMNKHLKSLSQNIGDLTTLTTTDKSSLVAAINEIQTTGGATGPQGPVGPVGPIGPAGSNGVDGHSPTLTWSGDQISIDGVVSGPHLTGPAGPTGADGAASDNTYLNVHQTSHGFSKGNVLYFNGTSWNKAKSDSNSTLFLAMVKSVTDVDNFTVQFSGLISGLSGLTSGNYYFVSDSSAGNITTIQPTSPNISNPCFFALSTTSGVILNIRPVIIG